MTQRTAILIVDDEADIRDSLREWLEDEGYSVATAADGAEALELLAGEQLPCVVVLDLLMPKVSGTEVYRRMQGDPRLATIPVVVSTSDPSRAPSGVLIMKKPVSFKHLLGTIRQHCSCAV
jgi:two-component system, sensor histidine kinase and response regulator